MWLWGGALECGHDMLGGSTSKPFTTPVAIGDTAECIRGCGDQKVIKTWGRSR